MLNEKTRILVPLDGSAEAESALRAIAPLVKRPPAEVFLLHALESPDGSSRLGEYLHHIMLRLRGDGVRAAYDMRVGRAVDEILGYVAWAAIDLLAMSTHGRTGYQRLRFGSVTEEVLRRAEVPALICRPDTASPEGNRLLVALDGSARAEEILPDATWLARRWSSTVDVMQAAFPIVVPGGVGEIPMYLPIEDPHVYLNGLCARLAGEGITAVPVVARGRAAFSITEHARRSGTAVICMTTHGRSGLPRVLMGSIAEEVIRTAPCPVLVRRAVRSIKPAPA